MYLVLISVVLLVVTGCKGVETPAYKNISPQELKKMLDNKESEDFLFVDVHIPEQSHIEKTDLIIPYNKIKENKDKFGKDKNKKIVLYCLGGGMGAEAAKDLIDLGFTDVSNLSGGTMGWESAGYKVED